METEFLLFLRYMRPFFHRLLTIFLMSVYTASAVEVSFSFHFCGESFRYVCFSGDTEEDCCGEYEKNTRCCTDKVIKAKIKDDQAAAGKVIADHSPCVEVATYPIDPIPTNLRITWAAEEPCIACNSSPPGCNEIPIFLKNRVFRI